MFLPKPFQPLNLPATIAVLIGVVGYFSIPEMETVYPVHAQTQTQALYVPLTLDENEYVSLRNYLNQQPYMFAAPVINLLDQAEQRAVKVRAEKNKTENNAPADQGTPK